MHHEESSVHGGAGRLRINSVQAESHRRQQPPSVESTIVRPRDRLPNVMAIQASILRANNALFPASFCHRWRIHELSLFGSVLRDDFGPASDIDVLVTFDDDAHWSLWDVTTMQDELSALTGRKVDLVERDGLRNPFRRDRILETRRVVYVS